MCTTCDARIFVHCWAPGDTFAQGKVHEMTSSSSLTFVTFFTNFSFYVRKMSQDVLKYLHAVCLQKSGVVCNIVLPFPKVACSLHTRGSVNEPVETYKSSGDQSGSKNDIFTSLIDENCIKWHCKLRNYLQFLVSKGHQKTKPFLPLQDQPERFHI